MISRHRGLPFPLSAACSAKQWLVTEPIRRKLTSSIDFVSTVISMRQKLYELQGDSLWEEPTEEKDILKRWKASNSIIHGNVNVSNSFFRECESLRMVLDFTVL